MDPLCYVHPGCVLFVCVRHNFGCCQANTVFNSLASILILGMWQLILKVRLNYNKSIKKLKFDSMV